MTADIIVIENDTVTTTETETENETGPGIATTTGTAAATSTRIRHEANNITSQQYQSSPTPLLLLFPLRLLLLLLLPLRLQHQIQTPTNHPSSSPATARPSTTPRPTPTSQPSSIPPPTSQTRVAGTTRRVWRCLRTQVRNALRQGDAGWPPRCCAPDEGVIGEGVVEWLGDGALTTFYRRRRAEMGVPVGDRVYCHVLTCSSFIPPAHHRTEEGGVNRIAECQCPQDPEMEAVMQTIEQHGYQFCSNCNAVVERIDGCNHIICRHEFCYLCGARRTGRERFCDCPQFGGLRPPRRANHRIRLEGAVRERLAAAAAPVLEPPQPQTPRPQPPPVAHEQVQQQQQPRGVPAWEPDEELRRQWEQEDAEARRGPPRDDRRMEQWQQEDAEARRQMEEMMRQFALEDAEARMALNRSPPRPPPAEPAPAPAPAPQPPIPVPAPVPPLARAPPAAAASSTPPPPAPATQTAPARNPARRPTGIPGRQPDRQPDHLRERVHGPGGLGLRGLPNLDNPRAPPLPTPARAHAPTGATPPPPPPPRAAPAQAPPRNPRGPTAIPGRQPGRQTDLLRERAHGPGGLGLRDLPGGDYPRTPVRAPATGRVNAPATPGAAARVRNRDPAGPRGTGSQAEAAGRQQQPHPDADVSAYLNDPDVRILNDDDHYRPTRAPPLRMGLPPSPYGYGMVAGPAAAPPPPPMVGGGMGGYPPGVMTVTQTGPGSVRYQYNWGIGGGQGAGGHDPYGGAQMGMGALVAMVYPPAVDLRRQMYHQVMGNGNGHLHYETRW
ncbi:hypothetical protein GE09DRAFT_1214631 [Coniochaeta sp. 2T2.1]|nr:hypothetical protein GE09DRAFT_1214631 [Coniochaeta sp. 2T2.1]